MELIKIDFRKTNSKIKNTNNSLLRALKSLAKPLELSEYVKEECTNKDIYVCSATNGKDCGVLLTHYNDNDCTDKTSADIVLSGIPKNSSISVYILDENNDMTLYNEITSSSTRCEIILDLPLFTSYYIEIKEI